MRKLIINGLLLIVVIFLICALILGLSRFRAVDEKEQQLQENIEQQHEQISEQETVVEETRVKVNLESTEKTNTTSAQTTSKPATTDEDVNDFWNDIG